MLAPTARSSPARAAAGCIVALDASDASERPLSFTHGCEEAFRAELATEGVRVVEP